MSAGPEDLRLLRDGVRAAFADLSPPAEVRRLMETERGWSPEVWRRLCGELGLAGLAVPESHGGAGFTEVELGAVFEEAGSGLLAAPLLATAGLAIPLLLAAGDTAAAGRYLPELCAGTLVATVAVTDQAGRSAAERPIATASTDGDGWRLTGSAGFVLDGAHADLVLVPAMAGGDLALFAVRRDAPGLAAVPLVTLDQTRKQAHLDFDAVPADRLATADAWAALARALDVARAMLACEQAGGAERCLRLTVDHVTSRVQFGRPIGSFQAVKQKVADMLIRVESAKSAAGAAARAAVAPAEVGEDLPVAAAVAKAYCSEAFVAVAGETIQLHGGIGFTWEHDAHLYFKRAWTGAELLGAPAEHLETVAGQLARTL
ncbi:acyl-CoA dehydrogenase family protein [Actinomadura craniellae]|uniref:acyl-CoA dehydrogenase family protein n=1 Tax=Actinomadura craniellae TaxID=2231787 RepID=UPI001F44A1F0|nr:acyl-CoA dehydrogenase family protein [Actinomadura craniellae]